MVPGLVAVLVCKPTPSGGRAVARLMRRAELAAIPGATDVSLGQNATYNPGK